LCRNVDQPMTKPRRGGICRLDATKYPEKSLN
jgi:hypothetical protein